MSNKFDKVDGINFKLYSDLMSDNIEMINNEIAETEKLYEQLKAQFDRVLKSGSPGVLSFIAKQTPNLITLRGNKINLIKELNSVNKMIIDSAIKTRDKEASDDTKVDTEMLKEIHNMLMHPNSVPFVSSTKEEKIEDKSSTEWLEEQNIDYEQAFTERLNNIGKKLDKLEKENNDSNENNSKEENNIIYNNEEKEDAKNSITMPEGTFFVCDTGRNLYLVDQDYNIIETDNYPDWIIEFEEDDDGNIINAVNQFDEEIEIIEFEEE